MSRPDIRRSTVLLRPLSDPDRDLVLSWRNSPDVAAQMFSDDVISTEEHRVWFDDVRRSSAQRYWMIEHTGRAIGVADLTDIDMANLRCEWAYYIGDVSARGQSTPGAVEYGVLDYAFLGVGLRKVSCQVLATNGRVAHMHRRFGFRDEGLLRAHVLKRGEPVDVIVLAMLRHEWLARRDAFARLFASAVTVLDPAA